jgi:hypothetical protein
MKNDIGKVGMLAAIAALLGGKDDVGKLDAGRIVQGRSKRVSKTKHEIDSTRWSFRKAFAALFRKVPNYGGGERVAFFADPSWSRRAGQNLRRIQKASKV